MSAAPGIEIGAIDGYRLWSPAYDEVPNPLLALEMRILAAQIGAITGKRVLDAGSGTGRWMQWAQSQGAQVFGVDACREMVFKAQQKPGLAGRSALGDIRRIPLKDNAVDLALCSFTIGYLPSPGPVFRELARVSQRLIVSDLHPEAARAGWTRSFRAGDRIYHLAHHQHSVEELDDSARDAGFVLERRIEPSFGEPERSIFQRAGKEVAFENARHIPAVLITIWRK